MADFLQQGVVLLSEDCKAENLVWKQGLVFTASAKGKQGQDNNVLHLPVKPLSHQPALGMHGRRGLCLWGGTGTVVLSTGSWGHVSLWERVHGTGRAVSATRLVVRPQHQAELWPQASARTPTMRLSLQVAQLQVEAEGGGTLLHCTGRNRDSSLKAERLSCSRSNVSTALCFVGSHNMNG